MPLALLNYRKEIALAVTVIALMAGAVWVRGVVADRSALRKEVALQKAQTDAIATQFNSYIQLNKEIADAIRRVKVQSNNYIQQIETAPTPVAAVGGSIPFIPSGVPQGVPGMPGFANNSSGRTAAEPPPGGPVHAGDAGR